MCVWKNTIYIKRKIKMQVIYDTYIPLTYFIKKIMKYK